MRFPLATQLKTRSGDLTKDARMKNALAEVKGDQSVARKRPGFADLGAGDAGVAQLAACWGGMLAMVGDSLAELSAQSVTSYTLDSIPSNWRLTVAEPTYVGDARTPGHNRFAVSPNNVWGYIHNNNQIMETRDGKTYTVNSVSLVGNSLKSIAYYKGSNEMLACVIPSSFGESPFARYNTADLGDTLTNGTQTVGRGSDAPSVAVDSGRGVIFTRFEAWQFTTIADTSLTYIGYPTDFRAFGQALTVKDGFATLGWDVDNNNVVLLSTTDLATWKRAQNSRAYDTAAAFTRLDGEVHVISPSLTTPGVYHHLTAFDDGSIQTLYTRPDITVTYNSSGASLGRSSVTHYLVKYRGYYILSIGSDVLLLSKDMITWSAVKIAASNTYIHAMFIVGDTLCFIYYSNGDYTPCYATNFPPAP